MSIGEKSQLHSKHTLRLKACNRLFTTLASKCTLRLMSKENLWIAAKVFVGLPLLFYLLLSLLEPQREIRRKPSKKVLIAFLVSWGAVACFIAIALAWNALR